MKYNGFLMILLTAQSPSGDDNKNYSDRSFERLRECMLVFPGCQGGSLLGSGLSHYPLLSVQPFNCSQALNKDLTRVMTTSRSLAIVTEQEVGAAARYHSGFKRERPLVFRKT